MSVNNCLDIQDTIGQLDVKCLISSLQDNMLIEQQNQLKISCQTYPKLRTFVNIKDFHQTSPCLTMPLSYAKRSILTKSRLGCLPLRLETCRYNRPQLPANERICLLCPNIDREIDCVYHLILRCPIFNNGRKSLFDNITLPQLFFFLGRDQQLYELLSNPKNIKQTAKYLITCFDKRSKIIY